MPADARYELAMLAVANTALQVNMIELLDLYPELQDMLVFPGNERLCLERLRNSVGKSGKTHCAVCHRSIQSVVHQQSESELVARSPRKHLSSALATIAVGNSHSSSSNTGIIYCDLSSPKFGR